MIVNVDQETKMLRQLKGRYNMGMHKQNCKKGFTLVELSLSMVFIAILSIAVVLVMTSAISSYHRGITLSKVDSVGSGLVDDIRRSIQASSAGNLANECSEKFDDEDEIEACEEDGGQNLASIVRYADVKANGKNIGNVPVFGALCTGSYSYIWNSGYFFGEEYEVSMTDNTGGAFLSYRMSGSGESDTVLEKRNFRLLKVKDNSRAVCEAAIKGISDDNDAYQVEEDKVKSNFNMAVLRSTDEEPEEYLGDSGENVDSNLAVYGLTTDISGDSYKSMYYYTSLILGTVHGGINVNASGNFCATPEGAYSELENLDYCAINKFNFAALAKGGQ